MNATRFAGLFLVLSCLAAPMSARETTHKILSFADLDGWEADDHQLALTAFQETCGDLDQNVWGPICAMASQNPNPQIFFELLFRPVLIENGEPALFTGYFEPELSGARRRTLRHRYPVYKMPPELQQGALWHTRADIENNQILAGRGLEIAWVDDPVELFFLQIQGSGRIMLDDGQTIRVGYGGANGHTYHSIGKELISRGVYQPHQVSAKVIQNWVRRNPLKGVELMQTNPSYVFFRRIEGLDATKGPLGAMNRSITAKRSIAVDPGYVELGAPVWLEKGGEKAFRRLMIAQDTGSAIKGAQRADIFFGTGEAAGDAAGRVRDPGRMVVLLPIEKAFAAEQGFKP